MQIRHSTRQAGKTIPAVEDETQLTEHDSPSKGGATEEYQQPPYQLATWSTIGAAVLGVLLLFSARCELGPTSSREYAGRILAAEPEPVLLPPPEMDDEYFPCGDCHEGEPANREVREFEDEHEDIRLAHGTLWCLHCHDGVDNDHLRLADDQFIEFEESWRLCTQCHGKKLGDWRLGIHGKRTGHWYGPRTAGRSTSSRR